MGSAIESIDNKNLYILPWNTSLYNDDHLYKLTVEIKNDQNNTIKIEHEFSFSTITKTIWTRSNFILLIHWPTIVKQLKFFFFSKLNLLFLGYDLYFHYFNCIYDDLNILSISSKTNDA